MSDIEKAIEGCKTEMYDIFKKHHTYYFWKEEDIQSYLYSLMLQSGKFIHRSEDKEILLTHREYTTKLQYDPKKNFQIIKKNGNRSRGEIDIVVLDPKNNWKEYSAEYKIQSAIELKFQREFITGDTQTFPANFLKYLYPDYRKITDIENDIEYGHLMYFVKSNRPKPLFNNIDDVKKLIKENKSHLLLEREVNLDKVKFTYMEIYPKMKEPLFLKNYDNTKDDGI